MPLSFCGSARTQTTDRLWGSSVTAVSRRLLQRTGDPLTDSRSPPEFHQHRTAGLILFDRSAKDRNHRTAACFSRGFFPYSVLPATGSHQTPTSSQPVGCVASSEFRTLSTLCSPHGLPGLFHPGPAHGVCPPRPYSTNGAERPFRHRVPLGVELGTEYRLLLQGLAHR